MDEEEEDEISLPSEEEEEKAPEPDLDLDPNTAWLSAMFEKSRTARSKKKLQPIRKETAKTKAKTESIKKRQKVVEAKEKEKLEAAELQKDLESINHAIEEANHPKDDPDVLDTRHWFIGFIGQAIGRLNEKELPSVFRRGISSELTSFSQFENLLAMPELTAWHETDVLFLQATRNEVDLESFLRRKDAYYSPEGPLANMYKFLRMTLVNIFALQLNHANMLNSERSVLNKFTKASFDMEVNKETKALLRWTFYFHKRMVW